MRGRRHRAAASGDDGGRTFRHLAALTIVALLASACAADADTDADPEPEATPAPGDDSAAGSEPDDEPAPPPPLDAATAGDRYVRWQQQTLALPPTDPDDLEVEGIGAGIVVPGSPAAGDLADRLGEAAESGVLHRGDVVAEAVEVRHDDEVTEAVLCVSLDAVETALATGEPTGERDPRGAVYHLVEVTYQAVDDDWLVASVSALEGGCVPDAVVGAVTSNWEDYIDALVEWLRRGAPTDDLGAIADLATDDHQQALRSIPGLDDDARHEREDLNHGLEVLGGAPTAVDTEWCFDPDRNPEAGRYDADGTFTPMSDEAGRRYEWAQWHLVDGHWRLAHQRSIGPDDPQAPDDHRCF